MGKCYSTNHITEDRIAKEFIIFSNGSLELSANLLIGYMVLVRNVK